MPHGAVRRADVVELDALELLKGVLHGRAVLAHDVRVIAHHLEPERVAVDLRVDNTAVQRAEAAEGVAREERVGGGVERNHRFGPVHHGRQHERQLVAAEAERRAVLHLQLVCSNAVEAVNHAEGLLVGHYLHARVILAYQLYGPAVVGLHVVDYEIVDGPVAQNLAYVLKVWHEEVHLNGVDEAHLLVVDQVRVVRNAVGQRPQALEKLLVAVVDANVIDFVSNLDHGYIWFLGCYFD